MAVHARHVYDWADHGAGWGGDVPLSVVTVPMLVLMVVQCSVRDGDGVQMVVGGFGRSDQMLDGLSHTLFLTLSLALSRTLSLDQRVCE